MLVHMVVGQVSLKNMSGPITIATVAGDSAQAGFSAFLSFLAVVSISLGIINLRPDSGARRRSGGLSSAEWIKGSPLSERALPLGHQSRRAVSDRADELRLL